ncbi:hypothetical protein PF004_g27129 [Phytophthora fragariae]|uniref:Uncharacterized protein n=1 Tax=Phytophthora fragariae TaxID=53985 RepID=A0A6G0MLF0_9STRA|nr:hypothetical protein PF004_g27129 [Phytophthora fragariae]
MIVAGSGATTGLAGISKLQEVVAGVVVTRESGLALAVGREAGSCALASQSLALASASEAS